MKTHYIKHYPAPRKPINPGIITLLVCAASATVTVSLIAIAWCILR